MEKALNAIKNIKLKLTLIFIVPAIGFIFFTYNFTFEKIDKYRDMEQLSNVTEYVELSSQIVNNIQKERGLSVSYLTKKSEYFRKALLQQYKETDKVFEKFYDSLDKNKLYNNKNINIIISYSADIDDIRKQTINNKNDIFDVLGFYSNLVKDFQDAIKILKIGNKDFFNYIAGYYAIMRLSEVSGLQRAIVSHMLESKNVDKTMYGLLMGLNGEYKNIKKSFLSNYFVNVYNIYSDTIDKKSEATFEKIVKDILKRKTKKIDIDAEKWWEVSTKYIDSMHKANIKILGIMNKLKNDLKTNAKKIVVLSAVFWISSIVVLIILLRIIIKLVDEIYRLVDIASIQKNNYEIVADFSQQLLYCHNEDDIIKNIYSNVGKLKGVIFLQIGKICDDENKVYFEDKRSDILTIEDENRIKSISIKECKFIKNENVFLLPIIRNDKECYYILVAIDSRRLYKFNESIIKEILLESGNRYKHILDKKREKELKNELKYKAEHDILTGLYNRDKMTNSLKNSIKKCKEDNNYRAFLFFDLDNFKYINDYYSHDIGDAVLKETAKRLSKIIKDKGDAFRIAGDEFGILIKDLDNDKNRAIKYLQNIANEIITVFKEPIEIEDIETNVTLSIGIKLISKNDNSYKDILIDADLAMYKAKNSGKNQYYFYENDLKKETKNFIVIRDNLFKAVENGDIFIEYQPKVKIDTDEVVGLEALVRWKKDDGRIIYPDEFLGVANSGKMMYVLNEHIFEKVYEDVVGWDRRYKDFSIITSVNIPANLFNDLSFSESIMKIIGKVGVKPNLLDFEIVEDALLGDLEHTVKVIKQFKNIGVSFSIDDFGTGYSSLNYLKKLPVDNLKIDKDFILKLDSDNNKEIVKMIIEFAKIFNLKVVAEGVETEEIKRELFEIGCDYYQGYLYSRPIAKEKIDNIFDDIFDIE